ncbi:hypothetical protein VTG60DRAFT_581 [Thermothelomyces hinnuleus]
MNAAKSISPGDRGGRFCVFLIVDGQTIAYDRRTQCSCLGSTFDEAWLARLGVGLVEKEEFSRNWTNVLKAHASNFLCTARARSQEHRHQGVSSWGRCSARLSLLW